MISTMRIKLTIPQDWMAALSLGLFLCSPMLRSGFRILFQNEQIVDALNITVLYIPVLLLVFGNPRRYIKLDFIILFCAILFFIGATYLFHPEYEYVFSRETYGVWDYTLKPYEALYGYLFFRFVSDPQQMLKILRASGYMMFPYFLHALISAKRRGYWPGVSGIHSGVKFTYSISYGYEVLFFSLVFFYCALQYKRKTDIAAFLLTVFLIFSGGSRGPVLFIGVFFILYLIIELRNSKRKVQIITLTTILFTSVYALYEQILRGVSNLIAKFGFSSRFIDKLLADDITNDSGRDKIWGAAISMIKEKPLGYGAMGSRHGLYRIIDAGYPHNLFLELLIDYGVFFGTLLIILIIYKSYAMMFTKKYQPWKGLFLCMFCATGPLMISMSYWGHLSFWACIAICVNADIDRKKNKGVSVSKWKKQLKPAILRSS